MCVLGQCPCWGFGLFSVTKADASRPLVMAHRKGPNGMGAYPWRLTQESGSLAGPGLALCLAVQSEHSSATQTHRIDCPTQTRSAKHSAHIHINPDTSLIYLPIATASGSNVEMLQSTAISTASSTQWNTLVWLLCVQTGSGTMVCWIFTSFIVNWQYWS